MGPWVLGAGVVLLSVLVYVIARFFIARGLTHLAERTENKFDDILVRKLRPFRFAWIAPLVAIFYFAYLVPVAAELIRQLTLFMILWLVIITSSAMLNAANAIYESSKLYSGVSIQVYLDLGRILLILVGVILTISLFTGMSPVVLLSGLGAVMAVLLLIFRDTLLSFVASLQIQSNDLVREGDWLEIPSYGADGNVVNIALHTVKIQNWDNTISVIPTYKLLETPYKNWRGMEESGGRRIKCAILIDINSIKLCDREMLERFKKIDLITGYIENRIAEIGPKQLSNMAVFRVYVESYIKNRPDIHQEGMTLMVRQLKPEITGLPVEVYAFTKIIEWAKYESIQADIFDHLITAIPLFDLRVFQQPSGLDIQNLKV